MKNGSNKRTVTINVDSATLQKIDSVVLNRSGFFQKIIDDYLQSPKGEKFIKTLCEV